MPHEVPPQGRAEQQTQRADGNQSDAVPDQNPPTVAPLVERARDVAGDPAAGDSDQGERVRRRQERPVVRGEEARAEPRVEPVRELLGVPAGGLDEISPRHLADLVTLLRHATPTITHRIRYGTLRSASV